MSLLIIYDTLVLGLELPATVNAAINRKIEQYYLVQEYGFRVEREKKESERKQIEANGIRDFQQTVTQGISDSYVRWRGIEATLQLAQSPNTKIVIIGSGKDGLPVILGNVDTPMQPNPAAPAAPPSAATLPDNSEAAKQRPAAASPPLLEKTPASNLPSPAERPSPTAVPRASRTPQDNARPARPRNGTARRSARSTIGGAARRSAHILDLVGDSGLHFAGGRRGRRRRRTVTPPAATPGPARGQAAGPGPAPRRPHPAASPPPPQRRRGLRRPGRTAGPRDRRNSCDNIPVGL